MFTTGSRKGPASKAPEVRHFKEQPAPDADGDAGDDATIEHEGPLNLDHGKSTGGDPYNTTGRFSQVDRAQKFPAMPEVPKIVPRR